MNEQNKPKTPAEIYAELDKESRILQEMVNQDVANGVHNEEAITAAKQLAEAIYAGKIATGLVETTQGVDPAYQQAVSDNHRNTGEK